MKDFIKELQDFRHLDWVNKKMSLGTPGDVLEDKVVNNFIGSKSLEYNLSLIPKGERFFSGKLNAEQEERLMEGLDQVLPEAHLKKIWEMIWKRWKRYVEICN